jgi:hypothetical protein
MVMHRLTIVLPAILAIAPGCRPEFEERSSEVSAFRILAVRSVPAEALPGKPVHYEALVAGPNGTTPDAAIDWGYCTLPKPLKELNDVSTLCFRASEEWIVPLGIGGEVDGELPKNGCRQFGSDVPEPKPGEPAGRPADPDGTGGYYQPVRLILPYGSGHLLTLGETRILCGLPGATREVLSEFAKDYRPNENPVLDAVVALRPDPQPLVDEHAPDDPFVVRAGETLTLRASWPACDATTTCGGAESFVQYDLLTRTLVSRRESMRVSWFSTAGSFHDDRTGRAEDDLATSADDVWTAPAKAGDLVMWVVLRDSRGGIAWKSFKLTVR